MEGVESSSSILEDDPFIKLYRKKEKHLLPWFCAEAEVVGTVWGWAVAPKKRKVENTWLWIPTTPCCLALAKLQYLFTFSVVGVWALKKLDCSYNQTLVPKQYLWAPIFVMLLHIFMSVIISMKNHRDSYLLIYYQELLQIKIYCMAQQTNPYCVPYVWFPKCITSHFTTGYLYVITELLWIKFDIEASKAVCAEPWTLPSFLVFFFFPIEMKHRLAHMVVWSQIELVTNKCGFWCIKLLMH